MEFVEHPSARSSIHMAVPDGSVNLVVRVNEDGSLGDALIMVTEDHVRDGETQKTSTLTLPWSTLQGLVARVAARSEASPQEPVVPAPNVSPA